MLTINLKNPTFRKKLRTIGHHLHPLVSIKSGGLEGGAAFELERALEDHELIKIKLPGMDRKQKQALLHRIELEFDATVVQKIGNIALVFRPSRSTRAKKLSNVYRWDKGMLRQTG